MRSVLRWFVVLVLAADAVIALTILGGALFETAAKTGSPAAQKPAAAAPAAAPAADPIPASSTTPPPATSPEAATAAPRATEPALDTRDAAFPGGTTKSPEGDVIPGVAASLTSAPSASPDADSATSPAAKDSSAMRSDAFLRLQRAYENMEPESAAKAAAALAARDKEAVIQLLMGWKPRTSGAILDALTQANPSLAADLSYEIWKRSGNPAKPAAETGR
jgi:hypothetical protein